MLMLDQIILAVLLLILPSLILAAFILNGKKENYVKTMESLCLVTVDKIGGLPTLITFRALGRSGKCLDVKKRIKMEEAKEN